MVRNSRLASFVGSEQSTHIITNRPIRKELNERTTASKDKSWTLWSLWRVAACGGAAGVAADRGAACTPGQRRQRTRPQARQATAHRHSPYTPISKTKIEDEVSALSVSQSLTCHKFLFLPVVSTSPQNLMLPYSTTISDSPQRRPRCAVDNHRSGQCHDATRQALSARG